jgi:hypothetical protein
VDWARVTAPIEKVTGPFERIPRHSEAFCVVPSPEAPHKSAPNGNQMATTFCADQSERVWRTGWARSSCGALVRRPSSV